MRKFLKSIALSCLFFLFCGGASAACHAVSVSGAGAKNGADWNNSFAGIPASPVRGDIYYLADGNYGSYHFSKAVSGTTTIEFRKAQSYDFGTGPQCSSSIGAGWTAATMGSSQANLGGMTISAGYGIFNGNGIQATPGCGGGGSNFTTGTNAALIAAIEGPPPTPKDCGIKTTGIFFDTAATTNDVLEYVELLADSTPANNDDFPVINSGNNTVSNISFLHVFGHNSAATFLVYMGHSGIRKYNYWWGTEVQGPDNNGTHGQYDQDCGNCGLSNASNNTVDAYSVMRDIAGTAVWTFLSSGTVSGWQIYGNVIYNTPGNTIGGASDAVLDCINSVTCSNFTFNQNTIMTGSAGPYGPQAGVGWGDSGGGSVTVENNLWYNIGTALANITTAAGVTITENHNSVLNAPSPTGFVAATDVKVASGSANPFVGSTTNNFSLASDNANWNARSALGSPYNIDIAGNTYTTDRGAYQYISFGNACTNPNNGSGNHCSPGYFNTAAVALHGNGTSADGGWALLNRSSDTGSNDLGCYYSGQITPAYHNLTIVQLTAGGYQCGQSDVSTSTQQYLSGSMVWNNLNYKPSEMPSGTLTIEASIEYGNGWSAFWTLGGGGNTSSSTGCQFPTIFASWDNIYNCNWSADASDSSENDISEVVVTNNLVVHNLFNSTSHACTDSPTNVTTNFHLYHMDQSSSAIHWKIDGAGTCSLATDIPINPAFVIIESRQQSGNLSTSPPLTMTVKYVQVCNGATCTAPDSVGGNTVYLDDFGTPSSGVTPPTNIVITVQ